MVKKTKHKSVTTRLSWPKITVVIILGILIGYFGAGTNLKSLTFDMLSEFIVFVLLVCVLALLLDIRRLVLENK